MAVLKESASGTRVLDSGDPPIVDRFGQKWSLEKGDFLFLNGYLWDWNTRELAYVEHDLWCATPDRRWFRLKGKQGPWVPEGGTLTPPFTLTDPTLVSLSAQVEAWGAELRADFARVSQMQDALSSRQAVTDAKTDAILGLEGVSQANAPKLDAILKLLNEDRQPVSMEFLLPRLRTTDGVEVEMAQAIKTNLISVFPMIFKNSSGHVVQAIGGTLTATVSPADVFTVAAVSGNVEVTANDTAADKTASVTATYAMDGGTNLVATMDIVGVEDTTPASMDFDTANMTTKPIPAAPADTSPAGPTDGAPVDGGATTPTDGTAPADGTTPVEAPAPDAGSTPTDTTPVSPAAPAV